VETILTAAGAITVLIVAANYLVKLIRVLARAITTVEDIHKLVSHNLRNHDSEPLYKTVGKLERDVELLKRAIRHEPQV